LGARFVIILVINASCLVGVFDPEDDQKRNLSTGVDKFQKNHTGRMAPGVTGDQYDVEEGLQKLAGNFYQHHQQVYLFPSRRMVKRARGTRIKKTVTEDERVY